MQLTEILSTDRIQCDQEMGSKKRVLENISQLICKQEPSLNSTEVFESLIAREKLGSTGLGKGIAIPHGRLKSGNSTIAAFIQLTKGVDFDAPDGQSVDLICALMVPPESNEEHLQILAQLSERFRQAELREKLRNCHNPDEIYQLLTNKAVASSGK